MNFNYDYFGLAEPARFYLCKTDNTIICELNGIDLQSVSYTKQINNFDTIQFDVHRYVNGEESNGYDMLDEAMYIFVDGIGYFRMSYPEVSNDGFDEYKSVSAQSCECELALKTLKNFKINTGETDSREYLINGNVKETDEGVKVAVKNIILYDELYKDFSLLDIAIEKVFGWKIGWVDQTIRETTVIETKVNDDGTVTTTSQMVDSKRSFDIDSKNVYAFLTQDVSKKFECIFDFNIMTRTINVYSVKDYGKDSNVFISYRNLIQTLNYAPAQEDNIMTRFEVRGGDDLTIDAVNFGSSTIENLSYYLSTKHVSQGLIDRYNQWLSKLDEARKKYMYYNRQYSLYMEKRDEINLRVPNDGLNNNWKQFTVKDLGTIKKKYTTYMDALKDVNLGYWDEKNQKWLNKGAEQDYIAYQGTGLYSGTAAKANSVPWSGVTGKPSTYTPSSHTHTVSQISDFSTHVYDATISRTANTVLAAPNGKAGSASFRALVAADIPSITKSKITDFPSSLPASDVYAWAKASSKPSYSWGEITGKPSTFAPSSHTHNYAGSSSAGGAANSTNAINWVAGNEIRFAKPGYKSPQSLHIGWAWSDGSKIKLINEYIFDGGDGNKTQVTASQFNGSLNGNASSASSVAWTNVSGRPSSLPASDVYSWAKSSSKPSYSWSEITSKPSTFTPASHTHAYIPLSGGTITGSIIRSSGGSWISARNNVAVRGTATGKDSWNPVVGQATPNGYWTIGNLASNDNLAFSYTSNTNYNAGNNSATTVYLPVQEGTIITSATIGSQSVKYATSAGSAGSVAWGNVSGKPSSYTPSSHTHDDRYYTETEINTKLGAKLGAVSANGYYGMARPDGNTSDWIRTTTAGIIPYQSGGAGAGHCGLGTSSWYFSNAYIDTVNCVNTIASELISTSLEYRSCRGGEVNRDWRFGSATGSGDQNWFGFYDYTYGYHGGIYGPGHSLRMGGEIQSTAANGFRAVQGKYGFIIRNDGANVYFMMTGNGDPWGGWNDNYTIFTPNGEWQVKKSPYDNGMSTARGYVVVSDSNDNRVYSISNYNANYLKVRCGLNTYHCTYSNSDIRLKKNINNTSITNALSVINSIKVRQFDWKETNIHQSIGFVADELEKLDPNFSQGGGVTKDGGIDVKSVNSFYLQGYIVKALQELSSQVSDLKQENKRLKQKLNMCN